MAEPALAPEPRLAPTASITLDADREAVLEAEAGTGENANDVAIELLNQQADIIATDKRNARWNALTAAQQEVALTAGEAA